MNTGNTILLAHGSGGRKTRELIRSVFRPCFTDSRLVAETDSAILDSEAGKLAFTTDAFVVDPIFFPGGDIGKLSVCGTLNDLAVSGAQPLWIAASFILEEGLEISDLENIARSMAKEADQNNTALVAADTKVVPRGKGDKVYITTTGIGRIMNGFDGVASGSGIRPGDRVIVSGTVGDHGASIFTARLTEPVLTPILSDCASVFPMIEMLKPFSDQIRFMRDPTRGGIATVLCEVTEKRNWGIRLEEVLMPVDDKVSGICRLSGLDPLYLACEGRVVFVASAEAAGEIVSRLKSCQDGKNACMIGTITVENPGRVIMETLIGGTRLISMLSGDPLPRIC
ncbi:MAG: hydrogenase expression/formation protein HypE [Bacteroidota bacterium]